MNVPMRLKYMFQYRICTIIDVDEKNRNVQIWNYTRNPIYRAFGIKEHPTFQEYGEFLESRCFHRLPEARDRLQFLVEQTVRITGLEEFGKYMGKVLAVDTFFLNEDRHTHNLAVLLDEYGEYHYCPMFDHGGALLSDTTLVYPMTGDVYALIENAKPKTFCGNFDEQLDIAEELYGQQIQFMFDDKEADRLLNEEAGYPQDIKERVSTILRWQKHRYQYLFQK